MATRAGVLSTAVLAIACCAGLPAIAAALSGVVVGVAAGLIMAVFLGVAAVLVVRSRRRRTRMDSEG